jgi:hypothetical protein
MLLGSVVAVLYFMFAFYTNRTLVAWYQAPVAIANFSAGLLLLYLPGIAKIC